MNKLSSAVLLAVLASALAAPSLYHGGHHNAPHHVIHKDPEVVSVQKHNRVIHPIIETTFDLDTASHEVEIPIQLPTLRYKPVTKTFKNVKTIEVPVTVTKVVKKPVTKVIKVPVDVVKTVQVPIKSTGHHGSSGHYFGGHDLSSTIFLGSDESHGSHGGLF